MKNILKTSITLILIFAISIGVFAEGDASYSKEYLRMSSVEEMYKAYHTKINELVNNALRQINSGSAHLGLDPDDAVQNRLCEDSTNVATICISLRAIYEYRGYEEALRNAYESPAIKLFDNQTTSTNPLEIFSSLDEKRRFIVSEIGETPDEFGSAFKILETTLDTYNEYMSAYQMHKSNLELQSTLESYVQVIGELRTETYKIPGKFHNATTTGGECT